MKFSFLFFVVKQDMCFSLLKSTRLKASSVSTRLASRTTRSPQSRLARGATSGSAAASRTSFPAREGGGSTCRTLTTTPPTRSGAPKGARSTRSALDRTCAAARSSFTTSPASLCSHWSLTCTRPPAASSAALGQAADPRWRPPTTGSSCQADSVTPCLCPLSCPAQRPSMLLLLLPQPLAALTTAAL